MNLDINDLPEEITQKVFLLYNQRWGIVTVHPRDDMDDYICIAEPVEVTFKIKPREDTVKAAIESLRRQIQIVRAAAEVECNQLEGRIQNLLALPNKSEES